MNTNGKKGLGGALSALGRSVTSGESFFISTATTLVQFLIFLLVVNEPSQ
jgi:hypothetical protein